MTRVQEISGWIGGLRVRFYTVALFIAAIGTAAGLVASGERLSDPFALIALAAIAAFAERGSIRLNSEIEVSISLVPIVFAAVVLGPLAAVFVAIASNLVDLRPRPGTPEPYLKWAVYSSTRTLTAAATGAVAAVAGTLTVGELSAIAASTMAGTVAALVLDLGFALLTAKIRSGIDVAEAVRALVPMLVASVSISAPVVAILAFSFTQLSQWTLPLFLVPALAAHRSFVLYQEQRNLTSELSAANSQLERANLSFATALVATLDARDRYTAGHSTAVARYARDIAARMGLSEEEQQLAHLCGLVHDIGKIGLPAGLLEKAGTLTLEERRLMEQHTAIGERILSKLEDYGEVSLIVRHHHERVDGHGYPDALTGDEIPLISRIIAVADAYDAMTSDRPYRSAMPSRVARLRLAQAVESQFDTSVVAAFEAVLASSSEEYRSGRSQPEEMPRLVVASSY